MTETLPDSISRAWALSRYEQVRSRLPTAQFPEKFTTAASLLPLMDDCDAFVFDSFGVLNIGDQPIPGARACIDALRARGKVVAVLTNAATVPLSCLEEKYQKLGFLFSSREIISSRQVLSEGLGSFETDMVLGVAAPPESMVSELPGQCRRLEANSSSFSNCDGFVLLSSQDWTAEKHQLLSDELARRPRPLLVANPDIVAPRENQLSLEPGQFAHKIAENVGIKPHFYGKPFGNAFDIVRRQLVPDIPSNRIAMIGDSLHTDILGGAAAGWRTVLVTDHGLMKDMDIKAVIKKTNITPDYIIPEI